VEEADLIHERGVAGTTLEDVKVAAGISGSQMYRYFPDMNELVQAVIDYQAGTIVKHNRQALGSPNGVEAWRKIVVTEVR
jgi:AcrR family transcriptional regulator